ncbi:hypothetical protein JJV70_05700 [Streptomyces sp. JJ66]|uniref:alpha/beta hydrolase n=1 Tax=Streptomyces sp. JJ66 TaxID=2803843 RepID=UPI001C56AEC8|nr:alpha/beta hydrolase [Streptomyces sp. JJ66]MBW1601610.1 hypothetical protein [Streptomyces sp. JJ66]
MPSTLTWSELRDLDLSGLHAAASGWAGVRDRAHAARQTLNQRTAALDDTEEGEATKAAVTRLTTLSENYQYIYTECGLINTALTGLAEELLPHQKAVNNALDDAESLKFTVGADGAVTYPAKGELLDGSPAPGGTVTASTLLTGEWLVSQPLVPNPLLDPNPNRHEAQDIADRLYRAAKDAREIDDSYAEALSKLTTKPGLDVTDAMWTDAHEDSTAVREAAYGYLDASDIPTDLSAAERKEWWDGLSAGERAQHLTLHPDLIGNLDGIPAAARDEANRTYLPLLMGKLEGEDTEDARTKLAGLVVIEEKLQKGSVPPMYLLGIGDEGNGRAIVSYGNPDTSRNVSAYVPGLGTALDEAFAKNDLERARHTALGAQDHDPSSASIVWLGYDAPQMGTDKVINNAAVMTEIHATAGAPTYNAFIEGLGATNEHTDPHITAIGHSYGSLTVGLAAQRPGGIPGADDIILLGSPGVSAEHASELGVDSDHVYVGAAENDPVTKLPSKAEIDGAIEGFTSTNPITAYLWYELADIGDDDIWFGKDPASGAFGANRFAVDDGPRPYIDGEGPMPAHSNYFNPEKDQLSADNVAAIVAGKPEDVISEAPR